ncbi:MAG: sarcosine oxidase subunit gamma [Tabrizicola sp.]|nr:sarcosine oxidase subunit gamma [Tabrizicola sp.]
MSEPVSALKGASFTGFASIREIGPLGMISLRHKGGAALTKAIKAAVGTKVPAQRRIEIAKDKACGWMSPDEYLLVLPYAEVDAALAALAKALAGEHHLAADVSDARAVFRVEGEKAAQVLQKLSPIDFEKLEPGEIRRSRAAQVAAAMWQQENGFTVVCFRSVAGYMMGLLTHSAQPGSELD